MGVRLRVLVFLLALTAGDYMLWQWSIAGGHDILSLLAGFTLVPLAAVSVGRLVLAGTQLLSRTVGRSSRSSVATRASRGGEPARRYSNDAAVAESDSPSGKLAA
jgi:hypothetical protein